MGNVTLTLFLLPPVVSIFRSVIIFKIITSLRDLNVFPCLRCNATCVGLYRHSDGWLVFCFLFFVLFCFSVSLTAWDRFLTYEKNLCLLVIGGA